MGTGRPSTTTRSSLRSILGRGLTFTLVSGIGLAGLGVFGSASSQAATSLSSNTGLLAAAPAAESIIDRATGVSRGSDRVAVDEMATQRAQQIAENGEAINQAQDAAALQARTASLSTSAEAIESEADRLRNLSTFLWPTAGEVSSGYGMRLHPILHYYRLHDGDDIGGACGQPVYAAQSGVVIKAEAGYNGGSGNNIRVDHGQINGVNVQTGYLHLTDYTVKVGQKVDKGDLVGHVGSTGLSTACHLHFSAYEDGHGMDPMKYIGKSKKN